MCERDCTFEFEKWVTLTGGATPRFCCGCCCTGAAAAFWLKTGRPSITLPPDWPKEVFWGGGCCALPLWPKFPAGGAEPDPGGGCCCCCCMGCCVWNCPCLMRKFYDKMILLTPKWWKSLQKNINHSKIIRQKNNKIKLLRKFKFSSTGSELFRSPVVDTGSCFDSVFFQIAAKPAALRLK